MASKTPWWPFGALFKSRKPPPVVKPKTVNPYRAVSIIPGKQACAAAYRFKGLRFLSRQAPRLPLPSCDLSHCDCRFKHHPDRRAGPRRRSDEGLMSAAWSGKERRRSGGRRSTDHEH